MAKRQSAAGDYAGLTCAACHTGQWSYSNALADQIRECCVTTDTVRAVTVVAGRRQRDAASGVAL